MSKVDLIGTFLLWTIFIYAFPSLSYGNKNDAGKSIPENLISITTLKNSEAAPANPSCDPNVPHFFVDMTGDPDSVWYSSYISREGNCCGTESPDRCISFTVVLDENAVGLIFDIDFGAIPPGALFYQVDCGPQTQVGEGICLPGGQVYEVTFCKPGANKNIYTIRSTPGIIVPDSLSTRIICNGNLEISGVGESTVTWNDITGGGAYNSYLSCTSGCLSTTFTPDEFAPSQIRYEVCGDVIDATCGAIYNVCDTVVVDVYPEVVVDIDEDLLTFCEGSPNTLIATATPVSPTYTYEWYDDYNATGNLVSTTDSYIPTEDGSFSVVAVDYGSPLDCSSDTLNFDVTILPLPVFDLPDRSACIDDTIDVDLPDGNTYSWNPSTGIIPDSDPTKFKVTLSSNITYTITATDSLGCSYDDQWAVTLTDCLPVCATATVCPAETFELTTVSDFIAAGGQTDFPCPVSDTNIQLIGFVSDGGSCPEIITQTYKLWDDCSNEAFCDAIITKTDNTAPLLTSPPPSVSNACLASAVSPFSSLAEFISAGGTASDNCGINPATFTLLSETITSTGCPTTTSRIYAVEDWCGNKGTVEHQIINQDIEPPVLIGIPADITLECVSPADPPILYTDITATDNCDTSVVISFNETSTQTFDNSYTSVNYQVTRTWTATDDCGNAVSESQLITVICEYCGNGIDDDGDGLIDADDPDCPCSMPNFKLTCENVQYYYIPPVWQMNPTIGGGLSYTDPSSLVISTPFGNANVNVRTTDGVTFNQSYTINQGTAEVIPLTHDIVQTPNYNTIETDRGLIIQSDQLIQVLYRISSDNNKMLITIKGEQAIGTRFRTGSQTNLCGSPNTSKRENHFISVMAVEDNTTVNFEFTADMKGLGPSHSIVLNAGETYLSIDDDNNQTITGTLVTSDKSITVISGSQHSHKCVGNGLDAGADQLIPTCGIGTEYVVTRGIDDEDPSTANYAVVVGVTSNTEIFINGSSIPVATINPGEYYTYNMPGPDHSRHFIKTSKPAYVYQFGSIQNNGEIGMAIAAPIDGCRGDSFVEFFKFPNSTANNVTALVPNDGLSSFTLNGNPYTDYSTAESIPGLPDWSSVTFDNSSIQDYNVLESDKLFNASQFVGNSTGGTFGYLTSFKDKIIVYDPATSLPTYNYFADSICADVPYDHCITSSSCSGNQFISSIIGSVHTGSYTIQPNSSCFRYIPEAGYTGVDTITVLLSDEYGFTQAVCISFYICGEAPQIAGLDSLVAVCDISEVPIYNDLSEFLANGGTTSDDCSGLDESSFAFVSDVSDGNSCPETITRTYEISNLCGISSTFEQTIVIDNTILPTLTGIPADTTVVCDAVPAPPTIGIDIIGQSNCGIPPTVLFTETRNDGVCANSYSLIRTWTVTDECKNEYAESQLITVIDTIPPTASNPLLPITVQCADDIPLPDIAEVGDAADNCTTNPVIAFVSETSDGNACPETIVRTYSISDECGNEFLTEQTITVFDDITPTASNPAPIQVECSSEVPAPNISIVTDAADNCTANPVVAFVSDVSDGNSCPEIITRTYSITDDCNNQITVEQQIIINDITPPTFTCLPDTSLFYGFEVPQPIYNLDQFLARGGVASDNCELDSSSYVLLSENTSVVNENGYVKRTYQIADVCGNQSFCERTITLIPPKVTLQDPNDQILDCVDEVPAPVSSFTELLLNGGNATSECGIDTSTFTLVSGISDGNRCPEIITRTYEVLDSCGNKLQLSSQITVDDNIDPIINCLPDTTAYYDSLVPPAVNTLDDFILQGGTASDNCLLDSTSFTLASEIPVVVGDNTVIIRTYSVADMCGNTATCEQKITVDEPEITTTNPLDETVNCIDEVNPPFTSFQELIDNGGNASSECGIDTTTFNLVGEVSDGNTCPQVITRTYELSDSCGNTISLSHQITVDDQIDPVITCLPDTVVLYDSLVPPPVNVLDEFIIQGGTASDNCELDSTSFTLVSEVPVVVGDNTVITRTYSVADMCGNTATCEQKITVDNPDATAIDPPNETVNCIDQVPGIFSSYQEIIDNGGNASSSCGIDTTTFNLLGEISDGNTCPQVITRTYELADSCGNTINLSHQITVDDQIDPVITCLPDTVVLYDSLVPPPTVNLDDFILQGGTASDNCQLDSTSFTLVSEVPSSVNGNTVLTRTYSVANMCGNTATCEQKITVDNPDVTAIDPPNETVNCIDQVPGIFSSYQEIIDNGGNASSSCGIDTTTFNLVSEVSDGNTCPQVITRTYELSDSCGNTISLSHQITVDDQIDPVITCLPDTVVYYDSLVPPPTANLDDFILQGGTASDNCELDSTSFTLVSEVPVVVGDNTVITRTYSVADMCGNTATCEQKITVDEPEIMTTNPPNETVDCIDEVEPPFTSFQKLINAGGSASSECGIDTTTFTLVGEISDGNTCPEVITRTYEIADSCGNKVQLTSQTTIDDQIDPVITCLPDTVVYYDSLVPPPTANLDDFILQGGTASDNCQLDSTSFTLVSEVPSSVNGNTVLTRTYSVADRCGNTATCEQTVTVVKPEIITTNPPDEIVDCINEVTPPYTSFQKLIDNGGDATSECGIDTTTFKMINESSDGNTCPQVITRTYSVTDLCGNIIPIEHRQVVDDKIDPIINCLPDVTVYYDTLIPLPVTNLDDFIIQGGTASDNCQLDSTSFILLSEVPVMDGDNTIFTRTYSVADLCGNTATCEQIITLEKPNTPPVAVTDEFTGGCNPISGTLLDNDYDPDGDLISINIVPILQPNHGDLTIMTDGSFKYEFIFVEAVIDSFIYEICDDHPDSKCDQAVVYIDIFADNDCDGIGDLIDIDDDDDGILDVDEGNGEIDSDGDGFPDSMDIDSDNDGIVDNIEAQAEGHFIPPTGFDNNQNGLDDVYEANQKLGIDPVDTDQDGTPDYLDLDTDDDGIPDIVEGFDIGAKGIAEKEPSNYDVDRDGLDDGFDSYNGRIDLTNLDNPFGSTASLQDFDGDGWRDWRDVDDDGDGIKTMYEDLDNNGSYNDDDLDFDGHPEYLDKRADCELFIPEGFSPNADGVHDFFQIYCIEKYANAKLLIFDRWGNKLYEHENYGNQDFWGNYEESWWDGTTIQNPNKKVSPGNYLYILETSPGASERGFVMVSY